MEQQQVFMDYEKALETLSIELEAARINETEYQKAIKLLADKIKETQGQVKSAQSQVNDYSKLFETMKNTREDKSKSAKRKTKIQERAMALVAKQNKVQRYLEEVLGANNIMDLS